MLVVEVEQVVRFETSEMMKQVMDLDLPSSTPHLSMTPQTQSGRKKHNMKTYVKPIVYIIMMAEAPLLSGSDSGGKWR